MTSFEDELGRQLAARTSADARFVQAHETQRRTGEKAADELERGLRELASYLATKVDATTHVIKPKRNWRTPAVVSPPGFPLQVSYSVADLPKITSLTMLTLLIPDGRIWRYYGLGPPKTMEYVNLREALTEPNFRVSVADTTFHLDHGELVAQRYAGEAIGDRQLPISKALAEWAVNILHHHIACGDPVPEVHSL